MTNIITAKQLSKTFGSFQALKSVDLEIGKGQIVGLIGANGAGKTTLINAILGLTSFEGELTVNGFDPYGQRDELMKQVSFISDVATLPKWMTVSQVVDFVEGSHPNFDREKALGFLKETSVPLDKKIKKLSKGMVVQVHLAAIMAIDAKLLVLDEPTLGLDILYRKKFYGQLLSDYFDKDKTIIITTHQVDEIENILTDVIFIREGEIMHTGSMDEVAQNWCTLNPANGNEDKARALNPRAEEKTFGRSTFIFNGADRSKLEKLGEVNRLNLSDLFVTLMTGDKK
jgi:ABC-2 type transport system ATP-binding protein